MVWWRWCCDEDGVGECDDWVFDDGDSLISPTRIWRLELPQFGPCVKVN